MKRANTLLLACLLSGAAMALSVTTNVMMHSYCGRANGQIWAMVTGGTPPYTYSWSNGGTDFQAVGLLPGTYTVTVTDAVSDQATADGEILLLNSYGNGALNSYNSSLGYCVGDPVQISVYTGQDSPFETYDPTGLYGPWPYSFSHPSLLDQIQSSICTGDNIVYELLFLDAQPGEYFDVDFTDANGCPGTMDVYVDAPFTPPALQIVGVGPSCQNGATGSMTVVVSDSDDKKFAIYVRRANQTIDCYATDVAGFTSNGIDEFDGLKTFTDLQPGDHYLIWTTDPFALYEGIWTYDYECRDSIFFNVPLITADCGSMSGRLYLDDDADCIMDFADNRVPGSIVTVEPGPYYLTTNSSGQYAAALPYGSYTVNEQHPTYVQSCPADVTLSGPGTVTTNTGCAGGQPLDVMVNATSGAARPGFVMRYGVHVRNLTAGSTGDVTLTLEVDPVLSFIASNITPASVAGNTITWTAPDLTMPNVFQERYLWADMQVPPDVLLIGTQLDASATITTTNTDGDLSNNTYLTSVTVTGSFDPNDKTAATSSGLSDTEYFLDQDEWIDYTIRFQNTGTDTAFNILITDTLPAELDPGSILMGAGSHPYTWSLGLTGTLSVAFANIMLPDSNVNEAASHGFVLVRIKPQDGLLPGTVIENTANIYFDFNPPVITEPSVLVAEFSTDVQEGNELDELTLFPNPAGDVLNISSLIAAVMSIDVIAVDGRVVMSVNSPIALDVSSLIPAVYAVRATLANGSIFHKNFVKR